jgi:hypothetical protein
MVQLASAKNDYVVNMLKGERAGGNCINYTNVAY